MASTNGYGAVGTSGPGNTTTADEEQPLLRSRKPLPKFVVGRLRKRLMVDIKRDWADVVLILCYVITGLLDSASISVWGSFVSMQTGEFGDATERFGKTRN